MRLKAMDALTAHFDKHFQQKDCNIIHPLADDGYHVDILLYEPDEQYPFWKLVTMGASDYKMPKIPNTIGLYNEYMMFVDAAEDLNDRKVLDWYCEKLNMVAKYAYYTKRHVTYGHSFEWKNDDPNDEMVAAFLEFPQVIPNVEILRCKTGLFKTVTCLQVVLLNREELDMLTSIGPQAFSNYLYPENGGKMHFLSQRYRNEKF